MAELPEWGPLSQIAPSVLQDQREMDRSCRARPRPSRQRESSARSDSRAPAWRNHPTPFHLQTPGIAEATFIRPPAPPPILLFGSIVLRLWSLRQLRAVVTGGLVSSLLIYGEPL
ncbi:hypothetical protein C8Q79DRAFT_983130 [Trametes meyenii]|nr:hypothetical protein C8Q79DRAFT_983130 [Trametes meyenii]